MVERGWTGTKVMIAWRSRPQGATTPGGSGHDMCRGFLETVNATSQSCAFGDMAVSFNTSSRSPESSVTFLRTSRIAHAPAPCPRCSASVFYATYASTSWGKRPSRDGANEGGLGRSPLTRPVKPPGRSDFQPEAGGRVTHPYYHYNADGGTTVGYSVTAGTRGGGSGFLIDSQ